MRVEEPVGLYRRTDEVVAVPLAKLGRHEGYIDPDEYDVTKVAKPGAENELLSRLRTPATYYWRCRHAPGGRWRRGRGS